MRHLFLCCSLTVACAPIELAGADTASDIVDTLDTDDLSTPSEATSDTPIDTSNDCPTARIIVQEGNEVAPGTILHLESDTSASQSEIVRWEWSVAQPDGSTSRFFPSANVPNPSFETRLVGLHVFRLEVYDAKGKAGCFISEYVVSVTTTAELVIELTWNTLSGPNDETPSSANADLDLHLLHPNAQGEYFSDPWDCFWDNDNPDWGLVGPDDDPSHWDSSEHIKESIRFSKPEHGTRYQIGIHHPKGQGSGTTAATIHVYVHGTLRDHWTSVLIGEGQRWDSHHIDWPSGTITRITDANGDPVITPVTPTP